MDLPPSIIIFCPFIYDDASEQRNCIAERYSSLLAILPRGINELRFVTNSSSWPLYTPPGDRAFDLIFSSAQYNESENFNKQGTLKIIYNIFGTDLEKKEDVYPYPYVTL